MFVLKLILDLLGYPQGTGGGCGGQSDGKVLRENSPGKQDQNIRKNKKQNNSKTNKQKQNKRTIRINLFSDVVFTRKLGKH